MRKQTHTHTHTHTHTDNTRALCTKKIQHQKFIIMIWVHGRKIQHTSMKLAIWNFATQSNTNSWSQRTHYSFRHAIRRCHPS